MTLPFVIKRAVCCDSPLSGKPVYEWRLIDSRSETCVLKGLGKSPVAPKWLRDAQAVRNSTFFLDKNVVL